MYKRQVGRFASDQALAAVGSNSSVISLMINLFVGISVGANVVIANYIGQKDERGIKNAIHTVSVIALTSGCLLLVVGLLLSLIHISTVPSRYSHSSPTVRKSRCTCTHARNVVSRIMISC